MISIKQIDEWHDDAEAATPAPWEARLDGWTVRSPDGSKVCQTYQSDGTIEQQVADQTFISSARESVPKMSRALEKVYQAMLDSMTRCQRLCGKSSVKCSTCKALRFILDNNFTD